MIIMMMMMMMIIIIVNASRFPPRPIAGLAAYRLRISQVLSRALRKQIGS